MKKKALFFSSLALSGALALGVIAVMSSKAGVPAHSEVSAYNADRFFLFLPSKRGLHHPREPH